MSEHSELGARASKPNTYELIGITHARYAGRDFYGEHASDMAELAYLRDWQRWGETEFLRLMRNHSADIAAEVNAPETPASQDPLGYTYEVDGVMVDSIYHEQRDAEILAADHRASGRQAGVIPLYERPSNETCEQRAPVERALARRVYLKSERDMSGYRVVIGFDTLTDVQAAHQEVADIPKAPTQKANSCVCGEPNSPGTHRTDGPCLAPIGDHHP